MKILLLLALIVVLLTGCQQSPAPTPTTSEADQAAIDEAADQGMVAWDISTAILTGRHPVTESTISDLEELAQSKARPVRRAVISSLPGAQGPFPERVQSIFEEFIRAEPDPDLFIFALFRYLATHGDYSPQIKTRINVRLKEPDILSVYNENLERLEKVKWRVGELKAVRQYVESQKEKEGQPDNPGSTSP